jgi:hypothetical protein
MPAPPKRSEASIPLTGTRSIGLAPDPGWLAALKLLQADASRGAGDPRATWHPGWKNADSFRSAGGDR